MSVQTERMRFNGCLHLGLVLLVGVTVCGCQRMAAVVVRNQTNRTINVFQANPETFLGVVPPMTTKTLEEYVLLKGTSDVTLVVKDSRGILMRRFSLQRADDTLKKGFRITISGGKNLRSR